MIPDHILLDSEYFGPCSRGERLSARVIAIFRDSTGDQWCAFELADMTGVYNIHLGSRFFHGFTATA